MRTIAILPIKNLGAAKQRLSGLLGTGSRKALAQAMFLDVLAALRRVSGVDTIAVVTGDGDAQQAVGGEAVILGDDAEQGQSAAAGIGIGYALHRGFERALLVPGDTPLLDPREVDEMLERCGVDGIATAIVPDRHGTGTNALLLSPPDAIQPSFGPGSCERHLAAARAGGGAHRLEQPPSLLIDVDTPEDLAELGGLLGERMGRAPLTRGALAQLDRSHVRRSIPGRQRAPAAPAGA